MDPARSQRGFAYRHLSDSEEVRRAPPRELVPGSGAMDGSDGGGMRSMARSVSVDARPRDDSDYNGSATPTGDTEPSDWASEDERGRYTGSMDMDQLEAADFQAMDDRPTLPPRPPMTVPSPPRNTTPQTSPANGEQKTTLYGTDLHQFVSIGSIDQIARHSNSVDWSDSKASSGEPDYLSLMDPYYDLTTAKLSRLFSLFYPDDEGTVSYEGFRRGLEAMGIVCADDAEFQAFIRKVDEDNSGRISYEEFQQVIQEIKLAQLFNDAFLREKVLDAQLHTRGLPPTRTVMGAIDYCTDRIRSVHPILHVEKFIYSTKPRWAAVRWINVEDSDALTIRRLSVRYRLHPLAVEDALDVDRERPKYEKYDEHSLLILQTVCPVDIHKLRKYQRMYRDSLYTREGDATAFELMSKAEIEAELRVGHVMTEPEQLSVYILPHVLISVQPRTNSLWSVVKARLDTSYSKVRQHGTAFLVYTIVDVCVDDLMPIAHTLGARLAMMERLLFLDTTHFDVTHVRHCSKQLKGLQRLCKPLNEVIVQMAESNDFNGEILRYFRDVQDHIAIVQDECDKHLDACRSLLEEFHNLRVAQQSDVSFAITLIAAIFLPAQFLTGLYGMNFAVMPELEYEYGYYVWWLVVLSIATITVIYLHFYKRWL